MGGGGFAILTVYSQYCNPRHKEMLAQGWTRAGAGDVDVEVAGVGATSSLEE